MSSSKYLLLDMEIPRKFSQLCSYWLGCISGCYENSQYLGDGVLKVVERCLLLDLPMFLTSFDFGILRATS